MDTEKEIEFLEKKLKLLREIKELQELIKLAEQPQYPVYIPYPVYPPQPYNPYPQPYYQPWRVTYTEGTYYIGDNGERIYDQGMGTIS
jgi:hypothetical protein